MAKKARPPVKGSFKALAQRNQQAIAAANEGLGGLSLQDFAAQAAAMARAQTSSQEMALRAQLAQLNSQGERRANVATGAYAGLGRLLSGIAPQIRDTYQQASTAQQQAGQGFSDSYRALADQNAQADAQFLQNLGAPQGQIDNITGQSSGADALYGLGGYIPSTSLGREGAAWSAHASTLPSASARAGQMEVADILRANSEQAGPINAELASLTASQPGLQAQIQNDLFGQALEQWQAQDQSKLNWAAFNLSKQELGLSKKKTAQDIKSQNIDDYLQLNPPAEPPERQVVSVSASKQAGIWVDKYGDPILFNGKTRKWKPTDGGSKTNWDRVNKNASSLSRTLYNKGMEEVPQYYPGTTTVNSTALPVSKQTMTRSQAYNVLWNEFFKSINGTPAARAKLRRFINRNLTIAGWPKPARKANNSTRVSGQPVG